MFRSVRYPFFIFTTAPALLVIGLCLAAAPPASAQATPAPDSSAAEAPAAAAAPAADQNPDPNANPIHWTHRTGNEDAEDNQEFSYGGETDFNSKFVWRGITLSNKPIFQPTTWVSLAGFTFVAEDNVLLGNVPDRIHLHNSYVSFGYKRVWKKLVIEPLMAGFLERPPAGLYDPMTAEASLKLTYPLGPFHVFTENAFDVVAYPGSYFGEAGIMYRHRFRKKTTIEITPHWGWGSNEFNLAYIGVRKWAMNYVGLDGSVTYYPKPYLYVKPHFEFSDVVDERLRTQLPNPTVVSVGLAVGLDF